MVLANVAEPPEDRPPEIDGAKVLVIGAEPEAVKPPDGVYE